ncbi:MAG: Multidrug resistance protein Stp [Candidatus Ordinivivax streblomastigis]|uniref:Multidrug resistance protein Stp n=1 Tax=Candidatus Ordinivivax streblomastigis TaxID=2540710 RepID=A0A5M8NWU6_9BACT|nr:MAG: Multidrug resistance protein Stp [Candidatus Ordinivivax streblomastigis]
MQKETNRNLALFVLCAASFLVPFMGSAINLSLPQISETFSMKAVSLSWIATSYLIATAVFQVPFARLADLFGRKKVFIAGLAIFSLTTFLCGLAPSGAILIVFRALSGLGCAMMFGTSMAILTSIFPPNERGKAIGINVSVVYFALASGPFLGGLMTHYWGWQSLFYLTGIVGFLVAAGAFSFLKSEWVESKGERFDYTGSAIFAAGLFCLIFGFSKLPGTLAYLLLAAGIAASVIFVFYELKDKQPVFNVRIFSGNKTFGLSSLSALINYACTSAIAFMMSLYLQYIRGFDARDAGLILIVQACVQCVVSLYAGRLSDRFNPSVLATAGMGIILAGLVGLIFLTPGTPLAVVIFLLTLLGFGFGLFSSPNTNVIMSSVDKKYYGQASATIGTMRLTGQAFSMGIAMMAISLHLGNRLIVPEVYPLFMRSFRVTFEICAVLCLIGTYASSFRTKKKA